MDLHETQLAIQSACLDLCIAPLAFQSTCKDLRVAQLVLQSICIDLRVAQLAVWVRGTVRSLFFKSFCANSLRSCALNQVALLSGCSASSWAFPTGL